MRSISRRNFVAHAATALVAARYGFAVDNMSSPFKVAVISDEISEDFEHACSVIANDFGLHYVELRGMWAKNLQDLTDAQIAEAQKILTKYSLQVTDIASPLFKVDWPGAPKSQYSSKVDLHGAAESTLKQQDDVLARSISLAKQFGTDKVRCFDFWRLDDVTPYRKAINEQLRKAAEISGKQGILLVLENEFACNTATGREAGATLNAVKTPHLALNWDPGNAVMRGEYDAFPGGWSAIPHERIHHCHVKNATKDERGKVEWAPVDTGFVDWTAQFRALKQTGYHDAVSLETHWKSGSTPEASSRVSWSGMREALQKS